MNFPALIYRLLICISAAIPIYLGLNSYAVSPLAEALVTVVVFYIAIVTAIWWWGLGLE